MLNLTRTICAAVGVGKDIRRLKPSISEGLVCSNFPALIQPVCLNLSSSTSKYTKAKSRQKWSEKMGTGGVWSPTYADREQAFFWWYRAEAHYHPKFSQCTQRTTSCQKRLVSDTRVSCPTHISALIPRSACLPAYSIDSPGSEQPNAPTPSWWDLKQAIRKSWIFCERKTESSTGLPVSLYPHLLLTTHACKEHKITFELET